MPTPDWTRERIPIGDSGQFIFHWMNADKAGRWFRYARAVARDAARIAALDAPVRFDDAGRKVAQVAFVYEVTRALAEGFNCLNIPWYTHPDSRRLYREQLAGPPRMLGGSTITALYNASQDYSLAWFHGDERLPRERYDGGSIAEFVAPLPRAAKSWLRRYYGRPGQAEGHPVEFAQSAGLYLDFDDAANSNGVRPDAKHIEVNYNEFVRNRGFAFMRDVMAVDRGVDPRHPEGYPRIAERVTRWMDWGGYPNERCRMSDGGVCRNIAPNHIEMAVGISAIAALGPVYALAASAVGVYAGGDPALRSWDDWRNAWFDEAATLLPGTEVDGRIPLKAAAPLRDYLPWLLAWTEMMADADMFDAVFNARRFVLEENDRQMRFAGGGGAEAFIQNVQSLAERIEAQQHQRSVAAGITAAAIAALGAGLSGVTAGISAVAAGAVSAIILLADTMIEKPTTGFGRDDLGRYKPVLERGWLSGDPSSDEAPPPMFIPEPPRMPVQPRGFALTGGWEGLSVSEALATYGIDTTGAVPLATVLTTTGAVVPVRQQNPGNPPPPSTTLAKVGKVAATAAIVYGLARVLAGGGRRSARRRT